MDFDAIVVGAGTAGSATALNLAPLQRVLLVERRAAPAWRIGESLPGAARRLLSDMGLLDAFVADAHLPRHALYSAWGGFTPEVRDALADPDGHGWQIDRVKFERRLRDEAVSRGATLASPARMAGLEPVHGGWLAAIEQNGRTFQPSARLVIDAAGRGARYLASPTVKRFAHDRLICAWIRARDVELPAGTVLIEAEADGWWYASPVPGDMGILAFHTDAGTPAARAGRTSSGLVARARKLPMLGSLLADPRWDSGQHGYCAANGAWLESAAGDGWLAVGDAALACDPLAAQGLFNALYMGLAAAETVHRSVDGDAAALSEYDAEVAAIRNAYIAHRKAWYCLETRWSDEPFWARRQ